MRNTVLWNDGWTFEKCGFREEVTLPHTWNAADGQDGGNDYYRGTCRYAKTFERPHLDGEELWIELRGAAMTAEVSLNGKLLGTHEGGYSTFRFELTPALRDGENELEVLVDNGANDHVYPQKADFTFYGGLYRDVFLITVPRAHFALEHFGGNGITVTPVLSEDRRTATIAVEAIVSGGEGEVVEFAMEAAGRTARAAVQDGRAGAVFTLKNPRLWNGRRDPYLYEVTASLAGGGDAVSSRFGIRSIAFDAKRGFLLNGEVLRLCGAARHQDREGVGSALTREMHRQDIDILLEMGANTVRLAHYQQDQYVYDLCDEAGLVVWAEIPYISEHLPEGRANTISQMTELIVQCHHHPSIVCWGLSNEITAAGGVSEELLDNHRALNELCHRLDPTRPTTMAHVFMLPPDDPLVMLPDIRSYNLYYGWYLGEMSQNDTWFDDFHAAHPDAVIGLSEFGADANPAYQSPAPDRGDWTESYQALYHEHMLRMWEERPYIWAMHVWNGFDFGADGRDEGGKPGQNQKGLVTFDRRVRKDAFYIYKAYLSEEPFVHICGRRYRDRAEEETEIRVYSNMDRVTLRVDGVRRETKAGRKVFVFRVLITGEHEITACAGDCEDRITVRRVAEPNPQYRKGGGDVVNWFDREDEVARDGYFSILDTMGEVKANPEANAAYESLIAPLQEKLIARYGDVARNVELPPEMQEMMDRMSVEAQLRQLGDLVTSDTVHALNHALNQVRRG